MPYLFNLRTPPNFNVDTILHHLPKNFLPSHTETRSDVGFKEDANKVALIMALFGWQGLTHERLGEQPDSVSCQACFRNLGLWLFKSKEVDSAGNEVVGARMSFLDVVDEHRDYCPWKNAASQNGLKATTKSDSTAVPGWEVAVRVMKNDYYLRNGNDPKESAPKVTQPVDDNASDMGSILDDTEDPKVRDEKDKERWARLRRVKSLFDTKNKRKSGVSLKEKAR